jgi:hypothetical protein
MYVVNWNVWAFVITSIMALGIIGIIACGGLPSNFLGSAFRK